MPMASAPEPNFTSAGNFKPCEVRVSAANLCKVRSGQSPFISKVWRWEAHIFLHSACLDQRSRCQVDHQEAQGVSHVHVSNTHTYRNTCAHASCMHVYIYTHRQTYRHACLHTYIRCVHTYIYCFSRTCACSCVSQGTSSRQRSRQGATMFRATRNM